MSVHSTKRIQSNWSYRDSKPSALQSLKNAFSFLSKIFQGLASLFSCMRAPSRAVNEGRCVKVAPEAKSLHNHVPGSQTTGRSARPELYEDLDAARDSLTSRSTDTVRTPLASHLTGMSSRPELYEDVTGVSEHMESAPRMSAAESQLLNAYEKAGVMSPAGKSSLRMPRSLTREYQALQFPRPGPASTSSQGKTRYTNIHAFEHNRFHLSTGQYIDASVDPTGFIRTMGPTKETAKDFWQMTWESKSSCVLMLTTLKVDGKEKCSCYWPSETGKAVQYGEITITLKETIPQDGAVERVFELKKGGETRLVRQLLVTNWPDHGTMSPQDFDKVINRADAIRGSGPMIVHCSAGVGRTGTFCAGYALKKAHQHGYSVKSMSDLVNHGRQQRVWSVQTEGQYGQLYGYANFLEQNPQKR